MKSVSIILLAVAMVLLSGCSTPRGSSYQPIIDAKGKNPYQYDLDMRECQALATRATGTGNGALAGAAAGAVTAAIISHNKSWQGDMTAKGALFGGAAGAAKATHDQETVVKNCMRGRGYRVLL